ncbi:MAG TPA: hypothetical protein VFI99_12060 [Nocardioides sp.]|jgi:hypothetical protein|nr:hypothetical protein [Nocardioides sp.]
MTTTEATQKQTIPSVRSSRPSRGRRAALAVTGFLACALPTVFTINITRMLLTGVESDHQFHQLTGQGLILMALWLGSLVPLLRAGWAGRRPSTLQGLLHLTFMATGTVCSVFAPGGGAPILMGIIVLTGGLVWLALPQRPRLRSPLQLDPIAAPLALVAAAVFTPYVIAQERLQNAATGYHAQNPHYFDMAWMTLALTVLCVLGALLPAARGLVAWLAAGATVTGVAGLAFGEGTTWSLIVLALGLATTVGVAVGDRLRRSR